MVMEYTIVFESIMLIGLMILIGIILAFFMPLNENTKQTYTTLIVNVGMPCIILSSILKVEIDQSIFKNVITVFNLSLFFNMIGIGIGWFAALGSKQNNPSRREIALLSGLGNTGFIGIPLCAAILGPEGALYAAIFDAGVDLVIWTVGVMILRKSKTFTLSTIMKSLINIPTLAIIFIFTF
jgi:malate permease and related proteins